MKNSPFSKITRLLKHFTPILLGILYFQGYAFHAGQVESYLIDESIYPISHDQIFVQTYFFYVSLFSYIDYILYTIGLLFLIMLLTSIVDNSDDNESSAKAKITNRFFNKVAQFILKHKNAFIIPLFLLAVTYAGIILILISIIPYQIGKKDGQKRFERLKQFGRYDDLIVKDGKKNSTLPGIILVSSDKFVTVLTKENTIKTIPFSEVASITHNLKGTNSESKGNNGVGKK